MNAEHQQWVDVLNSVARLRRRALAELRAALAERQQSRAGRWRGELRELESCERAARAALRALGERPQRGV